MYLESAFDKIDQRKTHTYRFDMDKDINWEGIHLNGDYFNTSYLKNLGVNTEELDNDQDLKEQFHYLFALSFCRTFVHLENEVVDFIRREYSSLSLSNSVFDLMEEEVKHTLLFKRYAKHLESKLSSDMLEQFNKNYLPPKVSTYSEIEHVLKTREEYHAFFWMSTVFFEEFTIHYFDQMKNDNTIQKTWYQVHKLHRQEEIQHVLTDKAYFDSLNLSESDKYKVSKFFYLYLENNFEKYLSLNVLKATFSEKIIKNLKLKETGFYNELLNSKSFRETRKVVPLINKIINNHSYTIGDKLDVVMPTSFSVANWLYDIAQTNKKIVFCKNIKGEVEEISYLELLEMAKQKLSYLREKGIKKGDVVILFLDDPIDILPHFWAAILGGIIPTIVAPPSGLSKGTEEFHRLNKICEKIEKPVIIHSLQTKFIEFLTYEAIHTSDFNEQVSYVEPTPSFGDELCFIQFSSGSTRLPKGVEITHRNIFSNIHGMRMGRKGVIGNETFVSWLPLYHDMGLIGYHLGPIGLLSHQVLMKPSVFIRKPLLWLDLITKYSGTQAATPNFGLNLILKHLKKSDQYFDLSSMRSLLVGAEPISQKVTSHFTKVMKLYNLDENALCPAYGLAESTLAVSMTPPSQANKALHLKRSDLNQNIATIVNDGSDTSVDTIEIVSCGKIIPGLELRVVNKQSEVLPTKMIGRVQIHGDSVTRGYYKNTIDTEKSKDGKWHDTGDLGFIFENELYITGREKDLLTAHGKNYFAHDLESLAMEDCEDILNINIVGIWNEITNEDEIVVFVCLENSSADKIQKVYESIKMTSNLQIKQIIVLSKGEFKKTSSGKPQRFKLKERFIAGEFNIEEITSEVNLETNSESKSVPLNQSSIQKHDLNSITNRIKKIWSDVLELDLIETCVETEFQLLGGNSLKAVEIHHAVEEEFNKVFDLELLIKGTTISKMALFITEVITEDLSETSSVSDKEEEQALILPEKLAFSEDDIAVIGTGIRVPGANNLNEFWNLLKNNESHFSSAPLERWNHQQIPDSVSCKVGSFLSNIDQFDPEFFSINTDEAKEIDPQQRIFLEVLFQALEESGVATKNIGVFASSGDNAYQQRFLKKESSSHHTLLASLKNMLSARAAKCFDFHGPAMAIDTACSSSLVAVHEACKSLRSNECEVAIAGGIQLFMNPDVYTTFDKAGVLSKDGISRPFDENASGLVPGEGCGVVILKRLSSAIADNDRILSVIKGSSVNNDGASLSGTVPNPKGQRLAIEKVYASTNICPSTVGYVEAHAAGTMIGDTVEVGALNDVFSKKNTFSYIGSVKSNVGHALSASGILGFLKVVAILQHKLIPATKNCKTPSSRIGFSSTVFTPATELCEFPNKSGRCRAAISSLGLGGTNVHMLLESYENKTTACGKLDEMPFFLSAPNKNILNQMALNYQSLLNDEDELERVCKASAHRGKYFPVKKAISVNSISELKESLSLNYFNAKYIENLAFVFPGPGTQYHNMGKDLYATMPIFKEHLNKCHDVLAKYDINLLDIFYGSDLQKIHDIQYAQIAVFSFGYSFAKWLESIGVTPEVLIGHSAGEYAAAAFAEVMSLEDALYIVMKRGQLMSECRPGSMAAIFCDEKTLSSFIASYANVSIAALNEKRQIVVSGDSNEIQSLLARLDQVSIGYKKLDISCAAHSPLMTPASNKLNSLLKNITFSAPKYKMYSTMNVCFQDSFDSNYWTQHLVKSVRFHETIGEACKNNVDLFLEIGASSSLAMAISNIQDANCLSFFNKNEESYLIDTLSVLFEGNRLQHPEKIFSSISPSEKILRCEHFERKSLWVKDKVETISTVNSDTAYYFDGSESCIKDHVANGKEIAPAAMLIDWMLHSSSKNLSNIIIERPFAIEDQKKCLNIAGENEDFELFSKTQCTRIKGRHIQGRYIDRSKQYQKICVDELEADFSNWYQPREIYEVLANNSLNFGPSLRTIQKVGISDKELFVELQAQNANYKGELVDPSLLDGAFQSLAAFGLHSPSQSSAYLGFSAGEIRFYDLVKEKCFAYIKLKSEFNASSDIMRFDLVLFNADGKILLEIDDFSAKRVSERLSVLRSTWEQIALEYKPLENYEVVSAGSYEKSSSKDLILNYPSFDELLKFCQFASQSLNNRNIYLVTNESYLISFFRSFSAENSNVFCKAIFSTSPLDEVLGFIQSRNDLFEIKIENHLGYKRVLKDFDADTTRRTPKRILQNMQGKTALIIGGNGGIGKSVTSKLEAEGVQVLIAGRSYVAGHNYFQCDLANAQSVAAMFEKISTVGKLDYIIHCAGVLDDSLVSQLDHRKLHAVMSPKVQGAQNVIDQASKISGLQLVVFVSSLTSIVPSPGQAHYSAANAFMDQLALKNNAFKTCSILFGPWKSVGMVAGTSYQENFTQSGLLGIDPNRGAEEVVNVIKQQKSGNFAAVNFVPGKKSYLLNTFNSNTCSPKEELLDKKTVNAFKKKNLEKSNAGATDTIEAFLIEIIANKLHLDTSEINASDSFQDLGLDSMGAVGLVKTIENKYQVNLYPTLFFEYRTINLLAKYLQKEVRI